MKALHPNLASRPYRDYRPVWAVAFAIGLSTLVLLAYNFQTAYRYFATTRETREEIARLEEQIATERSRTQALERQTRGLDTSLLRAKSAYINDRIAERAFSWSELLDDLEDVFPDDVRLTRLSPRADRGGKYVVTMDCMARDGDGMIQLIDNLLASPKFTNPFPTSENVIEGGRVRFILAADYHPAPRGLRE